MIRIAAITHPVCASLGDPSLQLYWKEGWGREQGFLFPLSAAGEERDGKHSDASRICTFAHPHICTSEIKSAHLYICLLHR